MALAKKIKPIVIKKQLPVTKTNVTVDDVIIRIDYDDEHNFDSCDFNDGDGVEISVNPVGKSGYIEFQMMTFPNCCGSCIIHGGTGNISNFTLGQKLKVVQKITEAPFSMFIVQDIKKGVLYNFFKDHFTTITTYINAGTKNEIVVMMLRTS